MKALTILQPYASLIMEREKLVENRTWKLPLAMLGQKIYVHAGLGTQYLDVVERPSFQRGVILGVVTITGCATPDEIRANKNGQYDALQGREHLKNHVHGPYCFILENATYINPKVKCKGALSFWTVPQEVQAQIK